MEALAPPEDQAERKRRYQREWQRRKRQADPNYSKNKNAAFRAKRPEYGKQWYALNHTKVLKRAAELYVQNLEKMLFKAARQRAKTKGIPFTITLSDVVIPDRCPVLGIELKRGNTRAFRDNSPSIDRIIPHLGYVPGNIAVISERANRIKNDATKEEIALLYRWLLKHETIH